MRRASLIASCLALACAQSIPGVNPPGDEVYFPLGITVIPDAAGQPAHLAVLSTNFDQRYNSGMVTTYRMDQIFALSNCGTEPCIVESGEQSLRQAQTDTLRVFSFGGDLIYVASDNPIEGNLFMAARGRNRLLMIDVSTDPAKKLLSCSTESAEMMVGSDCTPAYAVDTGFADPFSLVHAPGTPDLIGIGHVSAREEGSIIFGAVALARVDHFRDRPAEEVEGSELSDPLEPTVIGPYGAISGMAFAGDVLNLEDVFLTANLRTAPDVLVGAFTPVLQLNGQYKLEIREDVASVLQLNTEIGAIEMRSLTVDSTRTRAYASVRFFAPGDAFNAGIAVIDLTGDQMKVLSVLEFGDELQRPFLREVTQGARSTKLLYVGDIRRDKIYIVDVTTDQPLVVKEIDGRGTRTIDGKEVQARLLDSPSQMVFATLGTTTLGFVTNFGNSTIAVLDVSDADPRVHRIVARLGRNIDPEGEMEKPQ